MYVILLYDASRAQLWGLTSQFICRYPDSGVKVFTSEKSEPSRIYLYQHLMKYQLPSIAAWLMKFFYLSK